MIHEISGLAKVSQNEIAKKAFEKVGETNRNGAMLGQSTAQSADNLNSAAPEIYHKKDYLCQGEKQQSWTNEEKKPPTTNI